MIVTVKLCLVGGQELSASYEAPEELDDDEEVVAELLKNLTGDGRPGWRTIGDAIVFSQAVSAVSVEDISTY